VLAQTRRALGKGQASAHLPHRPESVLRQRSAARNAYVANADGTVSVISTASNTVTATVPVGSGPQDVAVSYGSGRS
jgi:YVTN family beta-propeller protein